MGHDAHFLQRLERVANEQLELALGLYRDHDLTRFILTHARAAEGAERVALALDDSPAPAHVVVAKNGAFVTCLGAGMSTGPWPVVTRGQLDAIATKFERVREGLALAKKRGMDETRVFTRLMNSGPTLTREDYLGATALLGPAAPVLLDIYKGRIEEVQELHPLLRWPAWGPKRERAEAELVHSVWALAHSATIIADAAPREWVERWAENPVLRTVSPWTILTNQCVVSLVLRAAWVVAKMGKPLLGAYKARFAKPTDPIDLRESGWALVVMALRHASLRGEIFRLLRAPPAHDPMLDSSYVLFDQTARLFDEKEDELRQEGLGLGRKLAAGFMEDVPSLPQFPDPELVPDELTLPALFGLLYDAHNGERGSDMMLISIASAAHARAEDFYWPASVIRATGASDTHTFATELIAMHRKLQGPPKTVRSEPRPGRNDPCFCGSGKKYKKCHGA